MIETLPAIFSLTLLVLMALVLWRWKDGRQIKSVWSELISQRAGPSGTFKPSMIADLPEPARRFFTFAIAPGTPLQTVAEISMQGRLNLGTKANSKYIPMRAKQILAPPHGFVWEVKAGKKVLFSGSDGATAQTSWSHFWLYGILPVVRAGGNQDHLRSAFGRYVAEAVVWTPAALLPASHVHWEAVDVSRVRVTMTHMGLEQSVTLSIGPDGRLKEIEFQRWSNANAANVFQLQPFGGFLSEYKVFDGYRLPTQVDAGNFFHTDAYFPFYEAHISSIHFLPETCN